MLFFKNRVKHIVINFGKYNINIALHTKNIFDINSSYLTQQKLVGVVLNFH